MQVSTSTVSTFLLVILLLFSPGTNTYVPSRSTSGFVQANPKLEQEKKCLVATLAGEAKGEPEEGIRAVLEVIINRKNFAGYPNSFCEVVLQSKQFSMFNHQSLDTAYKQAFKPSETKVKYLIYSLATQAVYGGLKPKVLDDPLVLFYHTHQVKPKWSRKMQKVKTVGNHRFFKVKERD